MDSGCPGNLDRSTPARIDIKLDVPLCCQLSILLVIGVTMAQVMYAPKDTGWIGAGDGPSPVAEALAWAVKPGCGVLVTFWGTVRDHSEGRAGVVSLEYEAYLEQVIPRLAAVASAAQSRWPVVGRNVLLHRVGRLRLGEVSVVVAVSTPHRAEAFEAARFCIDAVKASVPIWKRETWAKGSGWAVCPYDVVDVDPVHDGAGSRFPAGGAAVSPRPRAKSPSWP